MRCKTCRYYNASHWEEVPGGECRRRAPTTHIVGCYASFPGVDETYWCGEYEEKVEEEGSKE